MRRHGPRILSAARDDGVDPRRIELWGSSFSGDHVLAVPAADPSIAAVIAQAPFTDALPTLARVPLRNAVRATAKACTSSSGAGAAGRPC
ncbi:hypothetical protein [Mycobacterium sp. URHB0021]